MDDRLLDEIQRTLGLVTGAVGHHDAALVEARGPGDPDGVAMPQGAGVAELELVLRLGGIEQPIGIAGALRHQALSRAMTASANSFVPTAVGSSRRVFRS